MNLNSERIFSIMSRRKFISDSVKAAAFLAAAPLTSFAAVPTTESIETARKDLSGKMQRDKFFFPAKFAMGGTAAENIFKENSHLQIEAAFEAAWNAGLRYYDTSPFYGMGLSERRLGHFLYGKDRKEYLLSTKEGRIMDPEPAYKLSPLWCGPLNFKFHYDYTATGARRSVEDSLQRLGVPYLDVAFIHDLSPDTLGNQYQEYLKIAFKGAMPELIKMREEGIIKGWGLGVNLPNAIVPTIQQSDPDFMLIATKYRLVDHAEVVDNVFPEMKKSGVKGIIGAPLNYGFLAGRGRFNYGNDIPAEMAAKLKVIEGVTAKFGVDVRTAALQFSTAPDEVAAVIPRTSNAIHAIENIQSIPVKIPNEFWAELKKRKIIEQQAAVPKI